MRNNNPCPKCGCKVTVQGVRVLDRSDTGTEDLSVAAYRKPQAWLFKGEVQCKLWACVCGDCGYVELYAENPMTLIQAIAESQTTAE